MLLDQVYMNQAYDLAALGLGGVSPNPLVGAILVKDGEVIGVGYHKKAGEAHAEVIAIESSRSSVEGSTLYCTLEPCCHTKKKTPPCTQLLIKKKISRVVISCLDPNPEVAGKGVQELRDAGIEVSVGLLSSRGIELNRVFHKYITTGLPYLHLKVAQTLDGKISNEMGDSKWITDELARTEVHRLRFEYDAVMVGRRTAELDDPRLDIRLVDSKGKIPYRIFVGTYRDEHESLRLFSDQNVNKTVVIGPVAPPSCLLEKGISYIKHQQGEDWNQALKALADLGITSVLVEGGTALLTSLIDEKCFDRMSVYIAPVLLGNGLGFYQSKGRAMNDAIRASKHRVEKIGEQIRVDLDQGDFC